MVFINTTSGWGAILDLVGDYILGNPEFLGVWLLVLFISLAVIFRIDLKLLLILIVPFVIVAMATGAMVKIIGGAILLFVGFMLAAHFVFR